MTDSGLPLARVERLVGFYRLVRAGACAMVSPDVGSVLGRQPIGFDEFVRDYAAAWGAPRPLPHDANRPCVDEDQRRLGRISSGR